MLLRHSAIYFLARGVPGLINFLALAVYTRLLAPEQYGYYAMAIAVVGLINVVVWQWLRLGLLRFLASYDARQEVFLSTLAAAFLSLVIVSACMFGLALIVWPGEIWLGFSALALLLLWMQAWYELNLELARSRLSPQLYGGLASSKAVVSIAVGTWLAYSGYGAKGVLAGLMAGFALPALWMTWRVWRVVRVHMVDLQILTELARYGLPLTATFALGFVVNTSDRLLIGWLMNPESTGLYAAGYDLAAQTLGMLMSIINLAIYPIAVRALEREGESAARNQLQASATLMLIVASPVVLVWVMLAQNVSAVVLDAAYVDTAARLMPIIALATLVSGLQYFYFDMAFQFGKRTSQQIWVMLTAAMVNVALNFLWIPRFGLEGAAYATLVAYCAGLLCSWSLGRKVFVLPWPGQAPKIILAVAAMAMVIWPMAEWRGALALLVQGVAGVTAYLTVLILFDVGGIQRKLTVRWAELRR